MLSASGAAVLLSSVPAVAVPREPLIVTKLADPDPAYVADGESRSRKSRSSQADADSKIELAIETLERDLGQAEIVQQRQIQALCSAGEAANASPEQRFAYEASCRYSRH